VFGSYTPIFIIAGSAYLVALLVVHLINPRYVAVTKFTPVQG
jgi:MFS transporter, ACS family, hexuronate transporter